MPNLQQAATLAAYEQRSAPEQGRRQITEQIARDLAETRAVAFVNEHLDEYEDVAGAIQEYINTFVEVFRRENGLLTPVQYDAHIQATKDAEEELERANRWKTEPNTDIVHVTVRAQMAAWAYVSTRFIGIVADKEVYQKQAETLLKDPETLQYYRQYLKQYPISFNTRMEEGLTTSSISTGSTASTSQNQPNNKKRWWQRS
jgi:hypothetical protein